MVGLSYSTIKLLRTDPAEYRRIYIAGGPRPKETEYQIDGTLLHDLTLSPHVVDDKYIVTNLAPSSPMMTKYIERIARLIDTTLALAGSVTEEDIGRFQISAYEYSGYSESIENVIEKAKEFDGYLQYCLIKDGKFLLLPNQRAKIEGLISNKLLKLLNLNHGNSSTRKDLGSKGTLKPLIQTKRDHDKNIITDTDEFYWESSFHQKTLLLSKTTGMRTWLYIQGSFDHVHINHKLKTIVIKDLKKVKDLLKFTENIEERRLDLQAGTYLNVIHQFLKEFKLDYKVSFEFVVVDESGKLYPFTVSEPTSKKYREKATEELDKAYFHIATKQYDLPYEYYQKIEL